MAVWMCDGKGECEKRPHDVRFDSDGACAMYMCDVLQRRMSL